MAVKVGIKPRNFFWKMQTVFQRLNMVASGKMFVANSLPGSVLVMFTWNPLFHVIDQARGFAFINYQPRNSDLFYPLYLEQRLRAQRQG